MTIAGFGGSGEYKGCVSAQLPCTSRVEARSGPKHGGSSVVSRIVIIGGGPGGYEAALVAAQLDADVTPVEADGPGGACVLTDCVPSKTFIASSEVMTGYRHNERFGIRSAGLDGVSVDAVAVNNRVKRLALAQSGDIQAKLVKAGVEVIQGRA